jgi:ubiquinone/menaquinone biosynthesis C-methylase UbiE
MENNKMKYQNWKLEADAENIRDGAIELRARVAENMYYKAFETPELAKKYATTGRSHWRYQSVKKVELVFNKKISGRIIEVGAGTGWFSALMSKEEQIKEVYALDYDKYSVEKLFPLVFKNLEADTSKITSVLGSYNKMECEDNFFDYVISIGAIHHSENLTATFKEAYRVLKPGGILVALEHCHPNSYTIEAAIADNEAHIDETRAKKLYNSTEKIKVKDNSDHNYRICEFESSAYAAGFNVLPYIFELDGEHADDNIFKKPQPYQGFSNRVFKPYYVFNKQNPLFDNLLFIVQKPGGDDSVFRNTNLGMKKKDISLFSKLFNK